MAVPFLGHDRLRNCTLIHIVRDPLKVIGSFLNNLLFFREDRPGYRHAQEQFLYDHLPHLESLPDPVSRACYYYLRWNQTIEEAGRGRRYLLYPIERGPGVLLEFLSRSPESVELQDAACNAYARWPDHMRLATNLPAVSDDEIRACFLWKEVAALARTYGYAHPDKEYWPLHRGPIRATTKARDPAAERPLCFPLQPRLIEEDFHAFNVIQHRDVFYGVHQEAGPLDLAGLTPAERDRLKSSDRLFASGSVAELKSSSTCGCRAYGGRDAS